MNTIGPPATGLGWDEAAPASSDIHGKSYLELQDLRIGLRIRLEKEHQTPAAGGIGGEHRQGSAVCWIQDTEPTTRPDASTSLTSDDLGRIWLDTTNHAFRILTAIGTSNTWTTVAEVALAVYTAGNEPDRGLYMKGNELYFKGADGTEKPLAGLVDEDDMVSDSATKVPSQQSVKAFVSSGTVTMTNKTLTAPVLTSPVLNTGVSGTAVLDEDDMSSDSATQLATQQSIKAYVDGVVTGAIDGTNIKITLPGGLILQAFRFNSTKDAAETISFPEAFPTTALIVVPHLVSFAAISSIGASSFVFDRAADVTGTVEVQCLAIGH